MLTIRLPYNYTPRPYQVPLWHAFEAGTRRLLSIWHRRAGKDKTFINLCAVQSQRRVGAYYYFLPTYSQGKKIIWDGMDASGFRFLHHFPQELWAGNPNQTEMKLRLKNGSIFQIVGSDNIDSIMGTNPVGCVFSEFSLQDPKGWDFVRPILRENKGWAAFNGTPRGKNHLYRLHQIAEKNPEWFSEILSISNTGVLDEEDIQAERDAGMAEELIQQEFYCSFDSGMQGAYYTDQFALLEERGQITEVPYDESVAVDTWWDIGFKDSTAIWFVQEMPGGRVNVIDYRELQGKGLPYYIKFLREQEYIYRYHYAPWDFGHHEWSSGKTRHETALNFDVRFRIGPKLHIQEGIDACRRLLPKCWFDKDRCADGLDAMRSYRKLWDERMQKFRDEPYHDWSSHGADAFRTGTVARRNSTVERRPERYNPRSKRHRQSSWMAF